MQNDTFSEVIPHPLRAEATENQDKCRHKSASSKFLRKCTKPLLAVIVFSRRRHLTRTTSSAMRIHALLLCFAVATSTAERPQQVHLIYGESSEVILAWSTTSKPKLDALVVTYQHLNGSPSKASRFVAQTHRTDCMHGA